MPRTYSIAAAAKLTGLSIDTLRAWERRYGLVAPQRDAAGVRHYSDDDIVRLRLAHSSTGLGHPIRRVAELSNEQLQALVRTGSESGSAEEQAGDATVSAILEAIRRYDIGQAETLLNSSALFLRPEQFVTGILAPLMHQVGDRWESGQFSVAQEHLVSNLVRNLLGSLARLHATPGGNTVLFATPPGEPHEFGIALAASLASLHGTRICMLGPNVPVEEVLRAAHYLRPQTIVIGAAMAAPALHDYLKALDAELPAKTHVWAGGNGFADADGDELPGRVQYVATLDDFASLISRHIP